MSTPTYIGGAQLRDHSIQQVDLDINDVNGLYPSLTASRAQHSVFAGPIWWDGAPTFRALVSDDLPAVTNATNATTASILYNSNALINQDGTGLLTSLSIGRLTIQGGLIIGDSITIDDNVGSITSNGVTSSLFGTASYAQTASYAITTHVTSSTSYQSSCSWASQSLSASVATNYSANNYKACMRPTSGAFNGTNNIFGWTPIPIAGTQMLYLNGLLQSSYDTDDYSISGGTVTFVYPVAITDKMVMSYFY